MTEIIVIFVLLFNFCTCILGPFETQIAQGVILGWSLDDDRTEINFTFTAPSIGWMGFGFSTKGGMIYSDVYVASSENGEWQIRDYWITAKTSGCSGVCPDTSQGGEDNIRNAIIERGESSTTMKFSRYLKTNDENDVEIIEGIMSAVWAYSDFGDESLTYHSDSTRGVVELNLVTGESKEDKTAQYRRNLLLVHGVIMFVVWDISTAFSALFARYWHSKRQGIRIHLYMQQIVIASSLPSFLIAMHAVQVHYKSVHSIVGTVFLAMGTFQGAWGSVIVFKFPFWNWMNKIFRIKNPLQFPRQVRKIGRILHPQLGKVLFIFSFVNVYTGIYEYGANKIVLKVFWIWVSILVLLVVGGEVAKFRRRRKVKLGTAPQMSSLGDIRDNKVVVQDTNSSKIAPEPTTNERKPFESDGMTLEEAVT